MSPLIYDIGLHDGADTSHYLKEGCRVVAIDANPAAAENHFREYIQTGQLNIINRGVSDREGQLQFWICDDVSEWSSFHREIASRNGAKHHPIMVDCVPIIHIIKTFGVPDYMKVDIEGNDRNCIAALTAATSPRYISIEMDHAAADQDIQTLTELGYRRFKIICQNNTWHQVTKTNARFYRLDPHHFIVRSLSRFRSTSKRLRGRRLGESGPWGEKTSGFWHSAAHAHSVWAALSEYDKRLGTQGLGWWYDIHAKQ
jgi:FkbM family methyltransferase